MSQDPIFDAISRNFDDSDIEDVCAKLAQVILELDEAASVHLTFQSFLNILGRNELDITVVAAVNFLSSSKHSILDSHAIFVDEDGFEVTISDENFQQFLAEGVLIHPATGEAVDHPAEQIAPYFSRKVRA